MTPAASTATSPNISGMGNGNYVFRVKATKSGYADSGYTSSGTCVVALQCGAPPSINVPATNSTGTVPVSWGSSNVSGVTYILEYSKNGGAWVQIYSGAGTSASANITSIGSGSYLFRVKATKSGYADSGYTTANNNCVLAL